MKKNNILYEKIMRNISEKLKYILNEDIQNFDVTEYQDEEHDIIDKHIITKTTYKYFPNDFDDLKEIVDFKILTEPNFLDMSDIDTSRITDMSNLFEYEKTIKKLDLSRWNTSNVKSMKNMFNGCISLNTLDLSSFDTSNVSDMTNMFGNCEKLTILDLSNFDTSNVTDMFYMFAGCRNLISVDLTSFNTNNVTNMGYMFSNCQNIQELDLTHFNTDKVLYFVCMFLDCRSLEYIDISTFTTKNIDRNRGNGVYNMLHFFDMNNEPLTPTISKLKTLNISHELLTLILADNKEAEINII